MVWRKVKIEQFVNFFPGRSENKMAEVQIKQKDNFAKHVYKKF